MHPIQLAAGNRQIARDARAGCEHHGVKGAMQLLHAHGLAPTAGAVRAWVCNAGAADVHTAAQLDTLGDELLHAPLHGAFRS